MPNVELEIKQLANQTISTIQVTSKRFLRDFNGLPRFTAFAWF
jgi:hypothetical protein